MSDHDATHPIRLAERVEGLTASVGLLRQQLEAERIARQLLELEMVRFKERWILISSIVSMLASAAVAIGSRLLK